MLKAFGLNETSINLGIGEASYWSHAPRLLRSHSLKESFTDRGAKVQETRDDQLRTVVREHFPIKIRSQILTRTCNYDEAASMTAVTFGSHHELLIGIAIPDSSEPCFNSIARRVIKRRRPQILIE